MPAGTPLHARVPLPATGPYEIASFEPKRGVIRLVRNPKFREWSPAAQPSGFPDVIVEHFKGTPDAHVTAVLHGSADLASNLSALSPALLASLRTQHASSLHVNPSLGTFFLVLNTRVAPFDDVRVRQALNFAVDRARLRNLTVGQRLGQVTCQVLPPDFHGYRPLLPLHRRAEREWSLERPEPGACTAARALLGHRRPARHGLDTGLDPLRRGCGQVRRLGAQEPGLQGALPAIAPRPLRRGGQAPPPGGLRRLVSRTSQRHPASSSRLSPAAPLRELETPSSATGPSTARSRAPSRYKRAIPRPPRACGPRSTATSSTRRHGSPSQTASNSRSPQPASTTTSTTPSSAHCSTRSGSDRDPYIGGSTVLSI